eukprot:53006-Alexandrium_andersonii.AAC.1
MLPLVLEEEAVVEPPCLLVREVGVPRLPQELLGEEVVGGLEEGVHLQALCPTESWRTLQA